MSLYYFVCVVPAAIFCAASAVLSLHRTYGAHGTHGTHGAHGAMGQTRVPVSAVTWWPHLLSDFKASKTTGSIC
jgi:hypothetical protein